MYSFAKEATKDVNLVNMYIFYYHLPVFRFGLWVLLFCCDGMPCVVSYVPVSCAVLGYCELSRVVTY